MAGGSGTNRGARLCLFVEEDNIIEGAENILKSIRPDWKTGDIKYKIFTDGITNKLVGCFHGSEELVDDAMLVRVYGNKTDLLIDRNAELSSFELLHNAGLAPEVFATFENGLAYGYTPGVTLTVDSVLQPKIWRLVARRMAQMHKLTVNGVKKGAELWTKTARFLDLVPDPYQNEIKQQRLENELTSVSRLKEEFEQLKANLTKSDSPIVFSHNDLLLANVIYNEADETVNFIDYEYAGWNNQAFDIANHFAEFVGLTGVDYSRYPSEEFQKQWLCEYLKEYEESDDAPPHRVDKLFLQVKQFVLAAHFFWGIWALIQSQHSHIDFDFLEYAFIRFREYFNRKEENQSLKNRLS